MYTVYIMQVETGKERWTISDVLYRPITHYVHDI